MPRPGAGQGAGAGLGAGRGSAGAGGNRGGGNPDGPPGSGGRGSIGSQNRGGASYGGGRGGSGSGGPSAAQKAFDAKYSDLNAARKTGLVNDAGRILGRDAGLAGLSMGAGGGRSNLGKTAAGSSFGPMGGLSGARDYHGAYKDASENDLGTQIFGGLTGVREMGPIPSDPRSYLGGRAQWGAGVGGLLGGLGGMLSGYPGIGFAAGLADDALGNPLGKVNFGQTITDMDWGYDAPSWAGGFPKGNFPGSAAAGGGGSPSGGTNLGSSGGPSRGGGLTPGVRSSDPKRSGGSRGSNREPYSTSGYIARLMGKAA